MWVDLESISVGDTRLIPRSKKWIDLITQQGTINLVQVWPFISYNWL
jgi:D-ribose pyranose/furanose isomerase RbsD